MIIMSTFSFYKKKKKFYLFSNINIKGGYEEEIMTILNFLLRLEKTNSKKKKKLTHIRNYINFSS